MLDLSQDFTSPLEDRDEGEGIGKGRRMWHTFMYRDILGAGVIGQGEDNGTGSAQSQVANGEGDGDVEMNGTSVSGKENDKDGKQMEVVIIERPIWDIDMPPRFDGGQDWEN